MIIKFTASNFEGDCNVDDDFVIHLEKMNEVAVKYNMIVIITSSFRKDTNVAGAIVTPAKMSNHLIGHAIDFNLKNIITGEYYNSVKMKDGGGYDELFCNEVVAITGLRWGMAFQVADSVHFDDGINIINPELWHKKYNETKISGCL